MAYDSKEFGLGCIREIIQGLLRHHGVASIEFIPEEQKLEALCFAFQFSPEQLDALISENSPVLRTIQGHAFEIFFDYLMKQSGYSSQKQGGDTHIDRVLNGYTLQLKTPTKAGTRNGEVQYKTHKTHGAKSELESFDYYHSKKKFADFLVGLITYDPLNVIILDRKSLPSHPKDPDRIMSPFSVTWGGHKGLNAFNLIGVDKINVGEMKNLTACGNSLLPRTSAKIGLNSHVIIDTILQEENFRIWDMNMRGFAREFAFRATLVKNGISPCKTNHCAMPRADKADIALLKLNNSGCEHYQIKGLTLGACSLEAPDPMLGIETQLSRGRINDHPTQSRLYLKTDFSGVIVCVEPLVVARLRQCAGLRGRATWEFYLLPVNELRLHRLYANRICSMQKIRYKTIQKYRVGEEWFKKWDIAVTNENSQNS